MALVVAEIPEKKPAVTSAIQDFGITGANAVSATATRTIEPITRSNWVALAAASNATPTQVPGNRAGSAQPRPRQSIAPRSSIKVSTGSSAPRTSNISGIKSG
jgi:hypothetical protein